MSPNIKKVLDLAYKNLLSSYLEGVKSLFEFKGSFKRVVIFTVYIVML